ncbi:MAG: ROK family protein [Acidaminobacteraceae bacterium]
MIITKEYMKNYNRKIIFKSIWDNEGTSRFELSKIVGLTPAGIGKIVNLLIEDNFIIEKLVPKKNSTKFANALFIDCTKRFSLIAYCHSKSVLLGIMDFKGNINMKESIPIDKNISIAKNYKSIQAIIGKNISFLNEKNRIIEDIVFVVNGSVIDNKVIDKVFGAKHYYNELIIDVQNTFDIETYVIECGDSYISNEIVFGNSTIENNIYYLNIDENVIHSMLVNGEFFHGYNNGAGSLNHIKIEENGLKCKCGKYGCFSTSLSWKGLYRRYSEEINSSTEYDINSSLKDFLEDILWDDIYERAIIGEIAALNTVKSTGKLIGRGIAQVVDYLNPEIIFISGLYSANNIMNIEINRELNKCSNHKNLQGVYIGEPKITKNKELKGGLSYLLLKKYFNSLSQ